MDDRDPNDSWSEPQPRKRWGTVVVVLLLAAAGIGITLFILNNNQPAAEDDIWASEGRLTLAEDDGKSLEIVDRQQNPEIWFRVVLTGAPVGETLSLTCDWVGPDSKVVHRNHYTTRPIDRANWPTHARHRFDPNSPVGNWTVRLKLRDRVLRSTGFEVQNGGNPAKGGAMSGICGFVGPADPSVLDAMLAAIDYRGDHTDTALALGAGLGYRWWSGRPGKAPGIHKEGPHLVACAGTLVPPVPSPAVTLLQRLRADADDLAGLDGAVAAAWWDGDRRRLTLLRDPFGVRSLYYVEHGGTLYFASELKQLLAVPGLPIELDHVAIHKYLTFSFVPGEDVPVRGVRRLLPGTRAIWQEGKLTLRPYFLLRERIDPALADTRTAVRLVRTRCREAVAHRLNGEPEVGLYLSGGLDSSGVAVWLQQAGVKVRAFSLDFGPRSVEKDQAAEVARQLQLPLTFLKVSGEDLAPVLMDLVWKLDLPFGDAVTGPQYLLGRAARAAGLSSVFNGEGGDQLFGGWTSKPMITAQLYAGLYGEDSREEIYLRSYHRFYGREEQLYTPDFRARVGAPGQRRALLQPHLDSAEAATFLNRVRLADIALKGSQNILPRMERLSNAWGLDARVPLFDRALAEASFTLPPQMKLHGACEKYVLKLALKKRLPREIVWRKKFGMSVPITDWVLGPLAGAMHDLLNPAALSARGLFRPEYVARLRQGHNEPSETRRRRVGERLWALAMLEAWLRVFIDRRGKRPGGSP